MVRQRHWNIPLVIYRGAKTWQAKNRLVDMIAGYQTLPETIKKYVPDYEDLFLLDECNL